MARNVKNIMRLIDIANDEMPIEKQFLNDLEHSIEVESIKTSRQPSKTHKPSSMLCERAMVYQVLGYEVQSSTTASMVGICESGTDRHLQLQKAIDNMKNNGLDCEYIDVEEYIKTRQIPDIDIVDKKEMETKLYSPKYNMSFLCDGIIKYKGKYYILEIKTESSNKFMRRTEVDESHLDQATAYSTTLKIDRVLFVYENRDVCNHKAFLLQITEDMKQKFISKIEYCTNYEKQNKIPPKPQNLLKKACSYCPYKKYCEKDMY